MQAGVNIPESVNDTQAVLEQTGLWGVPTDTTAAMFGGPQFVTDARGPIAIKPVSWEDMERLQDYPDRGEKCCTGC